MIELRNYKKMCILAGKNHLSIGKPIGTYYNNIF